MSYTRSNSEVHHRYLTQQEIQHKYESNGIKYDLFDSLLHEESQHADAESNAKYELMEAQPTRMMEEPAGQHHGCRCSKIGCLKLYCECFANGRICGGNCECSCCHNKQGNQMLANLRHPGHFKGIPALIPTRRCTCKKSMCQKRYCECYSAGLKCTQYCQCKDCQNGHPHTHEEEQYQNFNEHMMEIQVHA